ncbi:hypothetical protein SDC9_81062 [bioreactor metagenome]|uniref:Uncharacterized protein n=1 Tax=bioreactor metagenome TaxID=1076179 RepID=A0A644Z1Q9_9ZZZZ
MASVEAHLRSATSDVLEAPNIFSPTVSLWNGRNRRLARAGQGLARLGKKMDIHADSTASDGNTPDIAISVVPNQQTVVKPVVGEVVDVVE